MAVEGPARFIAFAPGEMDSLDEVELEMESCTWHTVLSVLAILGAVVQRARACLSHLFISAWAGERREVVHEIARILDVVLAGAPGSLAVSLLLDLGG